MKITKKEWNKVKKWLEYSNEVYGTVSVGKNGLIFHNNYKIGEMMFHTHPCTEKDGGYSPPSIKDMITYIKNRRRTPINYVISERGIYEIELRCNVRKFTKLISDLRQLKKKYKPGDMHHKLWMKEINEINPHCLLVKFEEK